MKHKYILWLVAAIGSLGLTHVESAVAQSFDSSQTITICNGDTVEYNGQKFYTSGSYDLSYQRADGTDSIHRLIVNIAPTYRFHETKTVRGCEVLLWHGQTITKPGTYYDSQKTQHGCDSVYTLTLTMLPPDSAHTYIKISDQQTYTWAATGKTYDHSGIYYDLQQTADGCDSVNVLHLTVAPTYYIDTTAYVCSNELPYHWHGRTFADEGVYEDRHETVLGYDSIYTLTLHVSPISHVFRQATICKNGSYEFFGNTLTTAGTYHETLTSKIGCDSIITLSLNVVENYFVKEEANISDQETYTWERDGKTYKDAGQYYAHFFTEEGGCDSTYMLDLHVWPTFHRDTNATICEKDLPYHWHGHEYVDAGTYYDKHTTTMGYDSIYTLHLTVTPTVIEDVALTICQNQSIFFNGKTYDHGGIFMDNDNCERTYRITVTVVPQHIYTTLAYFDGVNPYRWPYNGQAYLKPGIYDVNVAVPGSDCMDTYRLDLRIGNKFESTEEATICEGEEFVWHGKTLGHRGIGTTTFYYDSLKTREGMDSVYVLKLTVGKKYVTNQPLTICQGGSVTWNGITYKESGIHEQMLSTELGCDSLVRVIINVLPTYHHEDTLTLVAGESVNWNGQHITNAGDYHHYLQTNSGCDSTLTLHVGIIPAKPSDFLQTEQVAVCQSETPYLWRGQYYASSGTFYDSLRTADNLRDSVYMLRFTVYPEYGAEKNITQHLYTCSENSTINYHGKTYTEADGITDELVTLKTTHGCDSVVHVYLHFNQGFYHEDYAVYTNDVIHVWRGQEIKSSGDYYAYYTDRNGCDSVYVLHATVTDRFIHELDTNVCYNEAPFEWHGIEVAQVVGTRTYHIGTGTQDDPLYILTVHIWPRSESTRQLSICEGSSVTFEGQTFTEAGDFDILLKTNHNCDSIIHVHVNLLQAYHKSQTVYLKKGEKFPWDGKLLDEPGVYQIVGQTSNGCDSVVELILKEMPVMLDSVWVCQNELPYRWRGHDYTNDTHIVEMAQDESGRDTMQYELKLGVYPSYTQTVKVVGCENETVMYNGEIYTESGTYTQELQTENGCDSIITVLVTIMPTVQATRTDTISETELPYIYNGDPAWNEGEYSSPSGLKTDYGCDSVNAVRLFITPHLTHNDSIIVCEADLPYVLGDPAIMAANPEYHGLPIDQDSVVWTRDKRFFFHVIVRKPTPVNVDLCMGDSIKLNNVWVVANKMESEYIDIYDTIPSHTPGGIAESKVACDSVIRYIVHRLPRPLREITRHISDQDSILFAGRYRTMPGVYDDTLKTDEGCDSIVRMTLIVDKTYFFHDSVHICLPHDKAYRHIWADGHEQSQKIWKAGTYRDSLRTEATKDLYKDYTRQYKDSIYELVVTTDPSYYITQSYALCEGDSVKIAGVWRHTAGSYVDSLTTQSACKCDSIYQWNVHMIPSYRVNLGEKLISDQQTYLWKTDNHPDGIELREAGVYSDTLKAVNGCDSIVYMTLRVAPTYYFKDSVHICQPKHGKPYVHEFADGHKMTAPAEGRTDNTYTYWDSLKTTVHEPYARFDSVYHLIVTVEPTPVTPIDTFICRGSYLIFAGQKIDKAGFYYDTIQSLSELHCDSVIELRVRYAETYETDEGEVKIPKGGSYRWHWNNTVGDTLLTKSGVYRTVYPTIHGCDSVFTIKVTVCPTFYGEERAEICASELPYTWEGHNMVFSTTGVYYDSLMTVEGFDSVYKLDLHVLDTVHVYVSAKSCAGDSLNLNGKWLTQPGVYMDTLRRENGCDSIVHFTYQHMTTYYRKQTAVTDDKTPYIWHVGGHTHTYVASGVYRDTTKTVDGCDSIVELTLTVGKTYLFRDSLVLCQDETPYLWHGQWISTSGHYYDSLQTVLHHDSVYTLKMTVLPVQRTTQSLNFCTGDSYRLHNGRVITSGGIYRDTLTSVVTGCDSIVTLNIRFTQPYHIVKSLILNDGESKTVDDLQGGLLVMDQPGTYYQRGTTTTGCDSIIEWHVTFRHAYEVREEATICYEDRPYVWNNKQYFESGVYTYKAQTVNGMDSIATLTLTVSPRVEMKTVNVSLCHGETFSINYNTIVRTAGIYYDTLSTTMGCDSITKFVVNYFPRYNLSLSDTICQGDTLWLGKTLENGRKEYYFTEKGDYVLRLKSRNDCDSIINLHLVVRPSYFFSTLELITEDQLPHMHEGKRYDDGGIFDTKFATILGCDSTYRYELRIVEDSKASPWDTLYLCGADGSLLINGQTITEPGRYQFEKRSKLSGKIDSLYRVEVLRTEPYEYVVAHTICSDSTIEIGGRTYNTTGQYTIRLTTQQGCDSIIHLNLTVNPSYIMPPQVVNIPDYEAPYQWDNDLYYESGTYKVMHNTKQGCDSLVTLVLTIVETLRDTTELHQCDGQSVIWRGKEYTESGTYRDTVRQMSSMRSEIHMLQLRIITPTDITYMIDRHEICADDPEAEIHFTYKGGTPEEYSIYFDSKGHSAGFSDIEHAPFEDGVVIPMPKFFGENRYVRPDYYNVRLMLDNGECGNSVYNTTLLVKYPSWILEQNWSTTVSVLNQDYNGGHALSAYRWYINGALQPFAVSAHLQEETLRNGDIVFAELTRQGESAIIPTCPIVIENVPVDVMTPQLRVAPNTVSRMAPMIKITTEAKTQYRIVSQSGQVVEQGALSEGEYTTELPSSSGCYLIWGLTEDGKSSTQKVIVY